MKLESFVDVRRSIERNGDRQYHLLLGNGFSMAYDHEIFSYNALHEFISRLEDDDLSTILEVVKTKNYEQIMQQLDICAALIEAFGGNRELQRRIEAASESLKKSLLDAVNALHPEHVFTVPEEQVEACARFLQIFLQSGGFIFSTNYDLLLYWILMRSDRLEHCDGCGRELLNPDDAKEDWQWSELIWGKNRPDQNVFYVHGALQFFDAGATIVKEEYDTQHYLLENISERMERGEYPIFVTAGDSEEKLSHIKHNHYLANCYDNLCSISGSLVTFGFNFGEYDEHITDAINRAARPRKGVQPLLSIYVGVYSDADRAHIEQVAHRFRCRKVHIFDAKSVDVWGRGET